MKKTIFTKKDTKFRVLIIQPLVSFVMGLDLLIENADVRAAARKYCPSPADFRT